VACLSFDETGMDQKLTHELTYFFIPKFNQWIFLTINTIRIFIIIDESLLIEINSTIKLKFTNEY